MKRLLGVLALAAGFIAVPAVAPTIVAEATPIVQLADASADPISVDYCLYSLRGGGTLAPDNDVGAEKNRLERNGFPVGWSTDTGWLRDPTTGQLLYIYYDYHGKAGTQYADVIVKTTFACYRDGYVASGAYHDIWVRSGWPGN